MIDQVARYVMPAALSLLPPAMDTAQARALLLAIGLQESRFLYRRQVQGPARGFWQFERGGGVAGVMRHPLTAQSARVVLATLRYGSDTPLDAIHAALEHNDILACAFARLLLWTLPDGLPGPTESAAGWDAYLSAWRPGKPHPATWEGLYGEAWTRVEFSPSDPRVA